MQVSEIPNNMSVPEPHEHPGPFDNLRDQSTHPRDIFSLLLLLGGDMVQRATARLTDYPLNIPFTRHSVSITPVAFSFGWIAYAFAGLAAAIGDCQLMPSPDCAVSLINCDSGAGGFVRSNQSWLLGRVFKDRETKMLKRFGRRFHGKQGDNEAQALTRPDQSVYGNISLVVQVFDAYAPHSSIDTGLRDSTWRYAWVVTVLQICVVVIMAGLGNWDVVVITLIGMIFALATASLPQWRAEKWSAKRLEHDKSKALSLTRGNGSTYVMVIRAAKSTAKNPDGDEGAWDFESMAASTYNFANKLEQLQHTRFCIVILTFCWTILLFLSLGVTPGPSSWALIGIGLLGTLQNIVVAGFPVEIATSGLGLHAEPSKTIIGYQRRPEEKAQYKKEMKGLSPFDVKTFCKERPPSNGEAKDVMGTLTDLEKTIPGAGAALKPIFFPGQLWPREVEIWEEFKSTENTRAAAQRANQAQQVLRRSDETGRSEQLPTVSMVGTRESGIPLLTTANSINVSRIIAPGDTQTWSTG